MQPLPHQYQVSVKAEPMNPVVTSCQSLPNIQVSPPMEFGGAGTEWSPEELFMASIANCLVLSFRAIAGIAKFEWVNLECDSRGELDKVGRSIQFTKVFTRAVLSVSADADQAKAEMLLHKAERACFITNSLNSESFFECEIVVREA